MSQIKCTHFLMHTPFSSTTRDFFPADLHNFYLKKNIIASSRNQPFSCACSGKQTFSKWSETTRKLSCNKYVQKYSFYSLFLHIPAAHQSQPKNLYFLICCGNGFCGSQKCTVQKVGLLCMHIICDISITLSFRQNTLRIICNKSISLLNWI